MSGPFARAWAAYLVALRVRPVRTKMIASGILFVTGDSVAQLVIEERSIPLWARRLGTSKKNADPVAESAGWNQRLPWDPTRTTLMAFYGGVIFAPLAHCWLSGMERVKLSTRVRTSLARLSLDFAFWSPFACALFPTCLGFLEGKSVKEVQEKVQLVWWPTYLRAVAVFGPAQMINYSFVPHQHRLLVLQSVGLCWNIYLSYTNNLVNKRLADVKAHHASLDTPLVSPLPLPHLSKDRSP